MLRSLKVIRSKEQQKQLINCCGFKHLANKVAPSSNVKEGTTSEEKAGDNDTFYSNERETHFGFETVSEQEKSEKVKAVFGNVADRYDLMNDWMSAGVHRVWKDIFIERVRPTHKTKLIDVAGGTGDIAFRFLKYEQVRPNFDYKISIFPKEMPDQRATNEVEAQYMAMEDSQESDKQQTLKQGVGKAERSVLVCDINRKMLEVGQKRASSALTVDELRRIDWMEGDAENLTSIGDNTYDAYTIAFGIRNCVHVDKVLKEAFRVLRPGGRFYCLEFSHVSNPLIKWAYDQYSFQVIPAMGQVIAGDWDSYQYLVESIRKFPNQEEFKQMIQNAGFRFAKYENLTFGVAAIHSGFKL